MCRRRSAFALGSPVSGTCPPLPPHLSGRVWPHCPSEVALPSLRDCPCQGQWPLASVTRAARASPLSLPPAPTCPPLAGGHASIRLWLPRRRSPGRVPSSPALPWAWTCYSAPAQRTPSVSPSPHCPARSVPVFPSRTHSQPHGFPVICPGRRPAPRQSPFLGSLHSSFWGTSLQVTPA